MVAVEIEPTGRKGWQVKGLEGSDGSNGSSMGSIRSIADENEACM